ncbi:GNAT family N-acetyltransferase, partial [Streptomyces sp. BG9H]|nr:GNAT family N-acetyltransferase [Streptomyces anatolicus]
MERSQQPDLRLEPWSDEGGLALLTGLNTPEMTEHLGGPETPEKLADRHLRYLRLGGPDGPVGGGRMFRITLGGETAGAIGYWETTWQGEAVWETGWGVLPGFQG